MATHSRNLVYYGLAPLLVLIACLHMLYYLWLPSYADYGEPLIPILARNLMEGATVYGSLDSTREIVGSNYGPLTFLVQACALSISNSVFGSKLDGVVFAFLAMGGMFVLARQITSSFARAMATTALMVALLSFNLHYWYWNRPDSLLIALSTAAVVMHYRMPSSTTLIATGLLAGLAINLKLFAPIYLLPIAITALLSLKWRQAVKSVAAGAILFVLATALPFMLPGIGFRPYLENILMMPGQGLDIASVFKSASYGAVIVLWPAACWYLDRSRHDGTALFALTVSAITVVAILSGKPGGGPPYMMPFVPLALYIGLVLCSTESTAHATGRRDPLAGMLISTMLCAAPIWAYSWYQMSKPAISGQELAKRDELRAIFQRYPQAEMGHGDGGTASDEFHRVQKSFLGQVTRFDYVNYADQRAAGGSMRRVYKLLEGCSVPSWVFARGESPFTGQGYGTELFDDDVRARFEAEYSRVSDGRFYEVWTCRTRPAAGIQPVLAPRQRAQLPSEPSSARCGVLTGCPRFDRGG